MLEQFYHNTTKKLLSGFGSLFNDIWVARYDTDGNEVTRIKVPIAYAPKQKYLTRETQSNDDLTHNIESVLPRIGYILTSVQYDGTRKLETARRTVKYNGSETALDQRRDRVPYTLTVELYILAKYDNDALQILEQILPYFTPDFTITFKSFPIDPNIDVPITIAGINLEELYEPNFDERKSFTITMTFLLQAYYYGPVHEAKIIKKTITNFIDFDGLYLSGITAGASGLESYTFQATGGTMTQMQINVTGGATAGSFGPTGTYEKIVTDYEY